jgi:hypothetical protein
MTTNPASPPLLEGWLTELTSRLGGPARARAAIVAELRDGLDDATAAGQAAGLPPDQAAQAAIAEFGDPATIAAAFAPELAAARARRTGLALLASGPLIAATWLAAITSGIPTWTTAAGKMTLDSPGPWQFQHVPPGPWTAMPLLGFLVIVGAHAALLTIVATGRLSRWLPNRPGLAPTAAATAAAACALSDLAGLTLLTIYAIQATSSTSLPLASIAAATASLIRLSVAGLAARRRLADRITLA